MKQETSTIMKYVLIISRLFVGAVFVFSGFVKGVDPMGFTYKIEEYLNVFGFEWAIPLAFLASIVMCALEFTIGVSLLFNTYKKFTAWLLLLFMSFFLVLTFTDALTNKVDDCGCFGDAVKLTNWQTFWKNVVLMVPTIIIFAYRNRKSKKKTFERDAIIVGIGFIAMILFCVYNYYNEPVIDFRPWKVGNRMMNEEKGEVVNYVTYENINTGKLVEFPSSDLMKYYEDSTWADNHKWLKTTTHDPNEIYADGFSMLGIDGADHSKEIIGQEGYVMIATIHNLGGMTKKGIRNLKNVYREASEVPAIHFVILTCALDEDLQEFLIENNMDEAEYYFADDKAIKTILRSNPGLILLNNSVILGKWHYRNFPELAELNIK